MRSLLALFSAWTWRMAWRDSRRERRRLLVAAGAVIFGVGALAAIGSMAENLRAAIDSQAKELVGADLVLTARRDMPEVAEKLAARIGGEVKRERVFPAMATFGPAGSTRLVQVRSLEPGFPLYGRVECLPQESWDRFGRGEGLLVERGLALQAGVDLGDIIQLGGRDFRLTGILDRPPTGATPLTAFAPPVYLPYETGAAPELAALRSFVMNRIYVRTPGGRAAEEWLDQATRGSLRSAGVEIDTVAKRRRELGRALDTVNSFLGLSGFVTLLLGGLGIASAIHVHVARRLPAIATLRCLGCPAWRAFSIYLAQALALGAIGSLGGLALGIALQQSVPRLFFDVLPLEIRLDLVPVPLLTSAGAGLVLCLAFALLPLVRVRRVSPLQAFRQSAGLAGRAWIDPLLWIVLAVVAGTLVFLGSRFGPPGPGERPVGLAFTAALALIIILLAATAWVVTRLARRFTPSSWPYPIRQGLANLYRPRNQTFLFLLSAGLATCLILTMALAEKFLLARIELKGAQAEANLFLLDVKSAEREDVRMAVRAAGATVVDDAAVVAVKIATLNGLSLREWNQDPKRRVPAWVLQRDFRATFRAQPRPDDPVTSGKWTGRISPADLEAGKPVPVSLQTRMANDLHVKLGDRIGATIGERKFELEVASLRDFEWKVGRLDFPILLPEGLPDGLSKEAILAARAADPATASRVQKALAANHPSVTVIDVASVLEIITALIDQAAWVVRFMAGFTVAAGLVILVGTILAGQRERMAEVVLLRTLGASRGQVLGILASEYILLGLLAAVTGSLLALGAAWALAVYLFKVPFLANLAPAAVAVVGLAALTLLAGMMLSRGLTRTPPLAILRQETDG